MVSSISGHVCRENDGKMMRTQWIGSYTIFRQTQNVEKKIPENCRGPHFQTNPNIMIYMLMHYAYAVPEGVSYTGREREKYIYIYTYIVIAIYLLNL